VIKTQIRFNCGCGHQSTSLEEAVEHVQKTGHTINGMTGMIWKEKVKEESNNGD